MKQMLNAAGYQLHSNLGTEVSRYTGTTYDIEKDGWSGGALQARILVAMKPRPQSMVNGQAVCSRELCRY